MTEPLEMTAFVLVIGASSLDIKGRALEPLVAGTSNKGLVRSSLGGTGRNIAENLARLGVPTTLLSAVGGDGTGTRLMTKTTDSGVDTSHVLVDREGRTGSYVAILDHRGGLSVSVDDLEGLDRITPRYVNDRRRLFREAAMVVIDTNLSRATLKTVFRLAQRYRVPVCADPTSRNLAPRLRSYLQQLYMVTPNQAEAGVLLERAPINGRDEASRAPATTDSVQGLHYVLRVVAEKSCGKVAQRGADNLPPLSPRLWYEFDGGEVLVDV